jgi:hypothetical protein
MVLRKLTGLFVCTLILSVASLATAGVPDLGMSEATWTYGGTDALSLFNLPNGGGSAFAAAQAPDGTTVDATITVVLRDGNNDVIAGFPAEDLWLASADGGMVPCVGGAAADGDTDADGITDWTNALNAGGNSEANCHVMVSGDAITGGTSGSVFALHFNSADMNADGTVNLSDVGDFAGIFYGSYDYSADFFADGALNLADVGRLATGVGGSCP